MVLGMKLGVMAKMKMGRGKKTVQMVLIHNFTELFMRMEPGNA